MERKMEHRWENLLRGKWSVAGRIYGEENVKENGRIYAAEYS